MDRNDIEPSLRDEKGRFLTGNTGGGRPKGARAKLGEAFIEAMRSDFEQHGAAAIAKVRDEKPDQYLKVIASILPKEIDLGEETQTALANIILDRRHRVHGRPN